MAVRARDAQARPLAASRVFRSVRPAPGGGRASGSGGPGPLRRPSDSRFHWSRSGPRLSQWPGWSSPAPRAHPLFSRRRSSWRGRGRAPRGGRRVRNGIPVARVPVCARVRGDGRIGGRRVRGGRMVGGGLVRGDRRLPDAGDGRRRDVPGVAGVDGRDQGTGAGCAPGAAGRDPGLVNRALSSPRYPVR